MAAADAEREAQASEENRQDQLRQEQRGEESEDSGAEPARLSAAGVLVRALGRRAEALTGRGRSQICEQRVRVKL